MTFLCTLAFAAATALVRFHSHSASLLVTTKMKFGNDVATFASVADEFDVLEYLRSSLAAFSDQGCVDKP